MPVYRFGAFEADVEQWELRRDGVPIGLQPQPFKVLAFLLARAGRVVTREDLRTHVWGDDTHVDFDRGLNFCIREIRAALGESADAPTFIETLPKRGYKFIAPVASTETRDRPPLRGVEMGTVPISESRPRGHGLAWIAVGIVAFGLTLITYVTYSRGRDPDAPPQPMRIMIAVLPLKAVGDVPPYVAEGLTDELITALGRLQPAEIGVIARTSVERYARDRRSVTDIARDLRVQWVVEGSVRGDAGRVRVDARLIRASDQAQAWAESFDEPLADVLGLQATIARAVGGAVAPALALAVAATPPTRPEADEAYLRGRYLISRGERDSLRRAVDALSEAVRLDPAHARAHARLAYAWHLAAMMAGVPPREAYVHAREAATRARALAPNLAAAHAADGLVALWFDWKPAAAETALRRAIAIDASDADAWHDLAWALVAQDRMDEAVAAIRRAELLDPVSPRAVLDVGWVLLRARRWEQAARQCRSVLDLEPGLAAAQACLELANVWLDLPARALSAARLQTVNAGASPQEVSAIDSIRDPRVALQEVYRWRLRRLQAGSGVEPYTLAQVAMMAGDRRTAIAALQQAREERRAGMVTVAQDPTFDDLHDAPAFRQIVAAVRAEAR